jgi:hypothetical protein
MVHLFVKDKMEGMSMKEVVIYSTAFIFRQNRKTVRLSGFWTDIRPWVLTYTK